MEFADLGKESKPLALFAAVVYKGKVLPYGVLFRAESFEDLDYIYDDLDPYKEEEHGPCLSFIFNQDKTSE